MMIERHANFTYIVTYIIDLSGGTKQIIVYKQSLQQVEVFWYGLLG